MILISIDPYAAKRLLAVTLAVICLGTASCFA